jgi:hypothetical protein
MYVMNIVGHKGRQEVLSLTAVLLKLQVFWNVTLCCWVSGSGCFEDVKFLHLQGLAVQELLDPEDEGTVIFQRTGNYLTNKTVPHATGSESFNVK